MPLFDVYAENWETVCWFLLLENRWLFAPAGGYLRLDDHAIQSQMDIRGVKKKQRAKLMDGLLVMEAAALPILNGAKQ